MKRMLAMLLAVLMVFSLLPAQAFAMETVPEETTEAVTEPSVVMLVEEAIDETAMESTAPDVEIQTAEQIVTDEAMVTSITASGTCGDNLTWVLTEDGTLTVSGIGDMDEYSVDPAPWKSYISDIKSVVIGDGVTHIGASSFYTAENLTDISISSSVRRLGSNCFSNCDSLSYVFIPAGVKYYTQSCFANCNSLTKIEVAADNVYLCSVNGVLFNKDKTELLQYPAGLFGSYTIPSGIKKIGFSAFQGCSELTEIIMPDSLEYIDYYAFQFCDGLTEVIIPDSVTMLNQSCFSFCNNLERIEISNNIEEISYNAFYSWNSKLEEVVFRGNAPTFKDDVFGGVIATAYYPADNTSWTEDVMQDYGGSITWVPYSPTISSSTYSLSVKVGESKTIDLTKNGNYAGSVYFNRVLSNSNVSTSWGSWNGDTCPITITGVTAGTTVMTVSLRDSDTDKTLGTIQISITVTTDDYVVTFDPDNGQSATTVTVKPGGTGAAPSEIPFKLGYTFREWRATNNTSFRLHPGEVFTVSGNTTFLPVWSYIDIGDVTESVAGSVTPIYKNAHNFIWFTPSVTTNYQICSTATTNTFQSTLYILDNETRILAKDTSTAAGDQVSAACALTAGETYYISFVGLGSQSEAIPFMINRGFKVSYDGNGGSGEPSAAYFYYGEWTTISSTVPTRAGYKFLGWSTSKTATTPQYTPEREVEFIKDTTLYAVWEKTDDIVYGDVNYDGELNTNDVVIYSKYVQLGTIPNYYNEQDFMLRADLDRDGAITEKDLDILRNLIVGNYTQEDMHGAYTGIIVTSYPKTTYTAGEKLDTNGLEITLVYGAQKYKITEDLTVTGFDPNKVGKQTLTVTYHQFTTTYSVTVQAAHQHSYNSTVVKPTCTAKGYTQYTCSCGDSYKDNYVNPLGHTEVTVKGKAATCTKSGKTDGKKCSVCGTVTVAQKTISATGHKEVTVAGKAATCTEAGKTDGKKCSVCGTVTVKQTTIAATGHKEVTVKGKAATCTKSGKTDGKKCSVCGTVTVAQKTIKAKGHTYTDDRDATCNVCGAEREIAIASVPMYRMYDPNSGEHFYTGSTEERDFLVNAGWHYEGVGFNFPEEGAPVHRLYDPEFGEHLYTMDEAEMNKLLDQGWNYEGVAFNSAGEDEVPQYRLHNPNAKRGGYHFTGSTEERDFLISFGWIPQGIGWYSCLE